MSKSADVFWWWGGAKYADYGGASAADDRRRLWHQAKLGDPLPPLSEWTAPTFRQYLGEGPKFRKLAKIGDAPSSGAVNLISPSAAKALRGIWQRDAVLYPVTLEDDPSEPYFMVVVKTQLGWDGLDESRSEFGVRESDGKVYAMKKWAFHADKVGDHDLFVLPNSPTAYFVTRRFVDRVFAAKLKGFRFDAVYLDPKPLVS